MDSEEYLGWCPVENTVANRLKDNSLVHTLSSKSHIRKSTKIINQELKKSTAIKTYSQYLKCKKKILEKITENTDVTDESDFSDDDYKKFYNSFEVTSKDRSKSNVGDEGFMWLFIEKQGRKKTESELDNENPDYPHPHIWEPSIDISVIENISDPFEKPSKTPKQKRENGLIDKQFKAKSCSPHKSNTKVNIKNVISATTSKVDNNVSSKLTLMKETPVKEGKELQSSRTKKNVNKRPKDVKRNLTSVINGVSRKTPEASEGDDWNDEFVSSDFQAQSTQIFSDTLSDAHRGRRSVSRLRFSQNEVMNQPRDSGIEEDSREENVSVNKRADNKKSDYGVQKENKVQENLKPEKNNEESKNSLNNTAKNIVSNTRHKLPLKIIGEERVTTKYKIVSNKELKSIIEEKHTIIEQIKEDAKKKSESSSDSEYVDTQNGDVIDNSKQETEESSDEYYDLHEAENEMDSDNGKINDSKIKKRPDKEIKKIPRDRDQLLNAESLEESSIASETSKKNTHAIKTKNKQTQKIIIHPNTTSDQSMDESVISDIASLQSLPTSEKPNLSKESRKILNKSSDREESYEIELQQDLSDIVKNYKKSHFMNKNTEEDSKSIKSLDAKDYDSEDSEKSENEKTLIDLKLTEKNDEEVKVHEQTSKRLSQIKKSELADDEESSESEDEVKKDPPVQFILPDKKSDSEESEESEIEETPAVFRSKNREDDEEGNLSIHAERRLAEMKRIDFANYDDSEDSEEEKSPFPIKNTNAKKKNSKRQKLEDSNDSENPTQNASIKNNDIEESESDESEKADSKKDSKLAEKTITKSQDSDSEEEENVPNHTLNHRSQMKKTNLTNIDSSSDDDEIKLENTDQVIDNVKNQAADVEEDTMSSYEKQHLQKMKRLSFDNDSEDSHDSIDKKVEVDDGIDIEEHKVPMPEGYQESELPKLMVEDSFSIDTMEKTESGSEKASKSKKKNKVSSKQVKEATDLNEESDEESDIEEPKNILANANKVNVKLSDEDDDSDSDRSMSPSTTHRLSQYKKMNLIEKDSSSSSSSEDEDDKKNDVLSKQVEPDHFKSDESDEEKSENLLKSNETSKEDNSLISETNVLLKSISSKFSNTDNSKEVIKTCQADNNEQKRKATDKDKSRKNVIIHETQESAGTQENYVESQELFSSMEDLTEGQNKASVLDSNDDQRTANEVSATPEPTEISQEKITNIPQLIKKDKLLRATYESTMASSNFSPDEDIYLLEVPRNLFNNNLIGEQFSFSKTTLKVGLNAYEVFKRKVTPTLSCVFKSEDHVDSYETMNVRPAVSIVARRRKLVDEPDKPLHQEKQELEDTGNQSKSTESNPTKIKKKKAKTKDATDTKKIKTPKQVKSSDITTELDKKKKTHKKKADVKNSPGKTKESENYENSAHLLAVTSDSEILFKNENLSESPIKSERKEKTPKKENLKSLPQKVKKDDETLSKENIVVDTTAGAKKKKAKAKTLMDSPTKIKKEEITSKKVKSKRNKFDIKHFIQKPKEIKKVKEKKLPKLEHCKDDVNMKRKLSAICDDDRNLMDDKNNASLSPPLKKQKTLIRDATNVSEEDEKQVKLASKSKSKSKIKKVNVIVKTEKKSKVTKPKNTVAENDEVYAEASTSPSTSKSRAENQPAKAEAKKSSKKRKSDALLSDRDDPKAIEKPAKKKKTKAAGEGKPKAVTKAAKERMAKETAEVKNTLFSLFRKTMKCNQLPYPNNPDSNPDNRKYTPLEVEHTTRKKSRLDAMSSSSDEDDGKCNFNKSFKMREKPKPELHNGSSNSSSDFIPNSQSAFKSEDKKKPKKIFFNE